MIECPHCGNHYKAGTGYHTHLRHKHGITTPSDTPDNGPPSVTIAFTAAEWDAIGILARRNNITPEAVVRAMVQRVLASGPPKPRTPPATQRPPKRTRVPDRKPTRPAARATVVNAAGQRVCQVCRVTVLVKKNPHGPGRYPARCEACR